MELTTEEVRFSFMSQLIGLGNSPHQAGPLAEACMAYVFSGKLPEMSEHEKYLKTLNDRELAKYETTL